MSKFQVVFQEWNNKNEKQNLGKDSSVDKKRPEINEFEQKPIEICKENIETVSKEEENKILKKTEETKIKTNMIEIKKK